jgi:glycosyltransferase involved in cell wall biosynthesis
MRVLAMLGGYPPSESIGSWVATHTLLRALVARGHEADVVLLSARGAPYELEGVRVWPHTSKADPFRHLSDADVIVCHAGAAARPVILGSMHGIPVVTHVHSTSAVTASALRRHPATLTVFNSEAMAAELGEYAGQAMIVRPPVSPTEYATTPGDYITLINLSEDKGAEVFYGLAERFPDRQFLGVQGGYGTQVVDDLPNVELLDHVAPGRMRDEVYGRTRILLVPSVRESWGRVAVEAMASGIPVIAHPTDGLKEALGPAGVFVDRDDLDAWETALRRLLDGRRWRATSKRAHARAAELDPAAEVDAWCTEIEQLAKRRARTRKLRG